MCTPNEDKYSVHEIEELLAEGLNDAAINTIIGAYNIMGCERAGLSAEDLLNTVITKVLEGERAWPRSIKLMTYFRRQGESIIDWLAKKQNRHGYVESHDKLTVEDYSVGSAIRVFSHPSALHEVVTEETEQETKYWAAKVFTLFETDSAALCYLQQLFNYIDETVKKSLIMAACNLSEDAYKNARKRIKDKLKKRFPNGLFWLEQ